MAHLHQLWSKKVTTKINWAMTFMTICPTPVASSIHMHRVKEKEKEKMQAKKEERERVWIQS